MAVTWTPVVASEGGIFTTMPVYFDRKPRSATAYPLSVATPVASVVPEPNTTPLEAVSHVPSPSAASYVDHVAAAIARLPLQFRSS